MRKKIASHFRRDLSSSSRKKLFKSENEKFVDKVAKKFVDKNDRFLSSVKVKLDSGLGEIKDLIKSSQSTTRRIHSKISSVESILETGWLFWCFIHRRYINLFLRLHVCILNCKFESFAVFLRDDGPLKELLLEELARVEKINNPNGGRGGRKKLLVAPDGQVPAAAAPRNASQTPWVQHCVVDGLMLIVLETPYFRNAYGSNLNIFDISSGFVVN